MAGSAVDASLSWIETAVDRGCPDSTLRSNTRQALVTILREVRDVAGPDAASDVAQHIANRAEHGRTPSATQARKIAREELRDRGHEISMASPLARTSNG